MPPPAKLSSTGPRPSTESGTARGRLVVAGLTGGIASGKTTISRMFAEMGSVVLNADLEGHRAVAPGEPALAEVVAALGPEALLPTGEMNRRWVGSRVFSRPGELRRLNRIVHPRIRAQLQQQLEELRRRPPHPPVVVVEAALLLEAGWETLVDRVIVVVTQPSVQAARLTCGLGLSSEEAWSRIQSQRSLESRLRHAHYRVSGEGALEETQRQVEAVWRSLLEIGSAARHRGNDV